MTLTLSFSFNLLFLVTMFSNFCIGSQVLLENLTDSEIDDDDDGSNNDDDIDGVSYTKNDKRM